MTLPLDAVPEALRKHLAPEAPEQMRMMLARALLPMPASDIYVVLSFLSSSASGEVQATARKSIADLKRPVLEGIFKDAKNPRLLEHALAENIADEGYTQLLLLNANTPDTAVEWAARRLKGALLELIASNQTRLLRHSRIVEAIYFNPDAPMALTNRVFETAVRGGLDLSHVPGYREIYEAIFGREAAKKLAAEAEHPPEPEEAPPPPDPDEPREAPLPPEIQAAMAEDGGGDRPGVTEEIFSQVMAVVTVDDTKLTPEDAEKAAATGRVGQKPMHALIEEMNVPQKVRLALVGNKAARAILIKDSKAVVALAVLKSPQITDGEVAAFAKNRALSDRIIQMICRNRDWTRNKSIQMSLIKHPKTPITFTNRFVRALGQRDLKEVSRSRDVPGHVARLAKNLLQAAQTGVKPGG